ncbi:MAG: hypothetical protein ABIN01_06115 [Ferruginibacter sp.]
MNEKDSLIKPDQKSNSSARYYSISQTQLLLAILAFLIVISFVWIWKEIRTNLLVKEYQQRENTIIDSARSQYEKGTLQFLQQISKPYVWSARTTMLQGNLQQLDLYGNDMVKEKNFLSIMVADSKGKILSSTDKKYEGKDITSLTPVPDITADSTTTRQLTDSLLLTTSPIMSFNSRIGTLIINYSFSPPVIQPRTGQ